MRKGHARLRVGSQYVNFAYATPKEFRELLAQQESYPLPLGKIGERTYWHFQSRFYWENDGLMPDEVRARISHSKSVREVASNAPNEDGARLTMAATAMGTTVAASDQGEDGGGRHKGKNKPGKG